MLPQGTPLQGYPQQLGGATVCGGQLAPNCGNPNGQQQGKALERDWTSGLYDMKQQTTISLVDLFKMFQVAYPWADQDDVWPQFDSAAMALCLGDDFATWETIAANRELDQ